MTSQEMKAISASIALHLRERAAKDAVKRLLPKIQKDMDAAVEEYLKTEHYRKKIAASAAWSVSDMISDGDLLPARDMARHFRGVIMKAILRSK